MPACPGTGPQPPRAILGETADIAAANPPPRRSTRLLREVPHPLTVADQESFELGIPNIARIYDALLGGKDNYAVDREAAPGSYVVISHVTTDEITGDAVDRARAVYNGAFVQGTARSKGDIARFFDGLDLMPPGLVDAVTWRSGRSPGGTLAATLASLAAATAYGSGPIIILTAIPMLIIASAYRRLNMWNANCGASFEWVGRAISPYLGFLTGWLMIAGYIIGTVAEVVVLGPSVLAVFGSDSTSSASRSPA